MESPGGDDHDQFLTFNPSSRVALRPPPVVFFSLHPTIGRHGAAKFRPLKTGFHCCHSLFWSLSTSGTLGPVTVRYSACSRGVPRRRKIRGTHTQSRARAQTHTRTHTHRAQCLAVAAAGRGQEENFSRRFRGQRKEKE